MLDMGEVWELALIAALEGTAKVATGPGAPSIAYYVRNAQVIADEACDVIEKRRAIRADKAKETP
jgi:hypothetical protein